ncbi:lipopolysaccharide biosynthesis protein [Metabacillus fastidiosus]|uniref:lipopolysaccharide biosynthesis protein n=1 Tax=Metabacillus fastidiosus TaxID=1458 RepID=UPI002E1A23A0|nr:oligosaccharide flippase family protein [Metabacillus fastidiosus]MED4454472.1 oligosaccharide flippase family protein [Metabacillus fastidiosus]
MFQNLKRLGGDSLLYALMNVGTKMIAFIMLPIYTNFLTPDQYAPVGIIDRWTSMLIFLVILGTDSALAFYYFEKKDEKDRRSYIQSVMNIRLFMVLCLFLIVLIIGPLFANELLQSGQGLYWLYLSIGVLFLDTISALVLTVLRYEFHTIKVVVITVLKMFLVAVLSYLFLKFFVRSVEGILYGRIISGTLIVLLLVKPLIKFISFKFDRDVIKDLLKYGLPLVPASLAFWVILNSSSFFLVFMKTPTDVGIYEAATKFAALITLVTSGIQMAWRPYSMSLKDKPNNKELFSKVYIIILLMGATGVLVVATIMPYVILLLNNAYYSAYQYVALLSAATFLNFYYLIISVGIFFMKKTKIISYAFAGAAVINVILNIILIPSYSIWGIVASYLISYLAAIIYIFVQSQKLYYIPVSLWKMAALFFVMLAGTIGIVYVQEHALSPLYIVLAWVVYVATVGITRVDKDLRGTRNHETN